MRWPKITPMFARLNRKDTADQLQSPFFRILPLEVRQLIYAYAVTYSYDRTCDNSTDVSDLHIVTMKNERRSRLTNPFKGRPVLCHSRCKEFHAPCQPKCFLVSTCRECRAPKFGDRNLLSVALTCRRIHAESLANLYTQQAFRFGSLTTLTLFASTVPTIHFTSSIRRLRLDWSFCEVLVSSHGSAYTDVSNAPFEESGWDEVCDHVLLKMHGLRELWVRFIRDNWSKEAVWEGMIFEGVKRVAEGKGMGKRSEGENEKKEGLQRFEVDVNWLLGPETELEMKLQYPEVDVRVSSQLKRSAFLAGPLCRRVD